MEKELSNTGAAPTCTDPDSDLSSDESDVECDDLAGNKKLPEIDDAFQVDDDIDLNLSKLRTLLDANLANLQSNTLPEVNKNQSQAAEPRLNWDF